MTSIFGLAVRMTTMATCAAVVFWTTAAGRVLADQDPFSQESVRTKIRTDRRVTCPTPERTQKWLKPLDHIRAEVNPEDGPLPIDCSEDLSVPRRGFEDSGRITKFCWTASELWYQPLYFDEVPLERYGQSCCPLVQPVLSGVHFFGMFPIMSYKMGIDRTHDRVYTLGYYRPGSNAPCVRQRLPMEVDASLLEAGTWVGLILLLP